MSEAGSQLAASVLARLKNEASKHGEAFNPYLLKYVGFRLLYRLSISEYSDLFLLKGATMFMFWMGSIQRQTKDIDLLSLAHGDSDELAEVFRKFCLIECPTDAVVFDPTSIKAGPIREEQAYGGTRITLIGRIGTARIPLQVDIGLGDAVFPKPLDLDIPSMLSTVPSGKLRGYPVEAAIAEKFHAMVELGTSNSRMKDFFDIALLARSVSVVPIDLAEAIHATFKRRNTPLPLSEPKCLSSEFLTDKAIQARWKAFVKKNSLEFPFSDFQTVQSHIRQLIIPALNLLE